MAEPGDVAQRSPLVLVVLGTDAGDDGSDAILAGLAQGLAVQAAGVVVAGVTSDGGRASSAGSAPTRSQPLWRRSTASTPPPDGSRRSSPCSAR
jgi:hypothetical protein